MTVLSKKAAKLETAVPVAVILRRGGITSGEEDVLAAVAT